MDDLEPTLIFLAMCIPFFIGGLAVRCEEILRLPPRPVVAGIGAAGFIVYLLFGIRKKPALMLFRRQKAAQIPFDNRAVFT
jgi:hypothetical protein